MTSTYDVGDRARLTTILRDENGTAVNVTGVGAEMQLILLAPDGTQVDYTGDVEFVNTDPVHFTCIVAFDQSGPWRYKWIASGDVAGVDDGLILVRDDPFSPETATGALSPWCTGEDLAHRDSSLSAYDDLDDYALDATELLYMLSGARFPGATVSTVRPCAGGCSCLFSRIEGTGLILPGAWGWMGSRWVYGDGTCGCGIRSRIRLAGQVRSVGQVKIDGAVVSSDAYHVEDRAWLVRDDGGFWPVCQDLGAGPDESGSFVVTYTWGQSMPRGARRAAIELGVQLAREGHGQTCQLPKGWTQVTRQGITVSRSQKPGDSGIGNSGLPMVDLFLVTYNPQGRRRPPSVWSPDLPPYGRGVT